MNRREILTVLLVIPFVVTTPYVLPPTEAGWGRAAVAAAYFLLGLIVARFVATRLTR